MDTVIRVLVIYFVLLIGLRIMGKREFSQMSPIEVVTLLLIPELVSQALSNGDNSLTNALIAITTLLSIVMMMSFLTHMSRKAEDVMTGDPVVLVHNGKMLEKNMNLERISPAEVTTALRQNGLEKIEQAKWIVLEPDGKISVVPLK